MDRVKKGALEAVAKHQADRRAGKEQELVDPLVYWVEMQSICTTRLADVAVDLLTIPATSVPSERLFSVSGLMCAGEHDISASSGHFKFSFVSFQARSIPSLMQTCREESCSNVTWRQSWRINFNLVRINFMPEVNCVICLQISMESIE